MQACENQPSTGTLKAHRPDSSGLARGFATNPHHAINKSPIVQIALERGKVPPEKISKWNENIEDLMTSVEAEPAQLKAKLTAGLLQGDGNENGTFAHHRARHVTYGGQASIHHSVVSVSRSWHNAIVNAICAVRWLKPGVAAQVVRHATYSGSCATGWYRRDDLSH